MGTVTNIKSAENQTRIEVLELMLEKAKSGELDELFLVGMYQVDGQPGVSEYYRVDSPHFFSMSAGIESALFDRSLRMAKLNGVVE